MIEQKSDAKNILELFINYLFKYTHFFFLHHFIICYVSIRHMFLDRKRSHNAINFYDFCIFFFVFFYFSPSNKVFLMAFFKLMCYLEFFNLKKKFGNLWLVFTAQFDNCFFFVCKKNQITIRIKVKIRQDCRLYWFHIR